MSSEEQKLSRAEWERERAAELASKTVTDLASKVAALEFDLKAKRSELDTVKTQLPPEGSVILKGADKDRWEAYTALGKPDELQAALTERDTLNAEKVKRERQDSINQAAEAAGYKANVLGKLNGIDAVSFEVREIEAEGQKVKKAFVKDAEGKETPLSDYVSANFADFLPALTKPTEAPKPTTAAFPKQEAGGGKAAPASPVQARIQARQEAAKAAPDPFKASQPGGNS